jgi:beta-ketodecanoyl-[acyl-carrier-protein] synthase
MTAGTTGTAISGAGIWHPDNVITNAELCAAFNVWVQGENARNAEAIAAGTMEALRESTPDFVEKASGIKSRYVHDKSGLLDPTRLTPYVPDRADDEMSVQCEYAVRAAQVALKAAGRVAEEVDLVILGASNLQRLYPAIAIEVQHHLGARGWAFDMAVGCSSATFAIQLASESIRAGSATCALIVVPEMTTGHMNFHDRDSHFIFGDVGAAVVVESLDRVKSAGAFEILSTRGFSKYSSNIRNNGGYLNRCDPAHQFDPNKLFYQQGRKVFKDVVPLASKFITDHVEAHGLEATKIDRYWLHQANKNMNDLIAKRLLGHEPEGLQAPLVLDEFGNTASAGSIVAFTKYHDDLASGAHGVICSFGAGYSIGSILLRRQ